MSQHADQLGAAAGVKQPGNFEQLVRLRRYAGPVFAAVDFDQDLERSRARWGGQRFGHGRAVGDQPQVDAAFHEALGASHFVRRYAHGVRDVREAVTGEVLGLGQGGHGESARVAGGGPARDLGGLSGLQMRAQIDASRFRPRAHPLQVALHPVQVDHGRRGRHFAQSHRPKSSRARGRSVRRRGWPWP